MGITWKPIPHTAVPMQGLRLLLLGTTLSQVISGSSVSSRLTYASKLTEWLKQQEGGHFNEKQELRHAISGDPTSRIGIFATDKIEKGEILSRVPWKIIIDSIEDEQDSDDEDEEELSSPNHSCGTFRNLVNEIRAGHKSNVQPYINYLLSSETKLPASFSENGQELFAEILDKGEDERRPLLEDLAPPFLEIEWATCGGRPTYPDELKAAEMIVQYSFNKLMVPTYDLYTHRNGKWLNTETEVVDGKNFEIVASRTITAGEQIHGSYSDCNDCHEGMSLYDVSDIFSEHGFIESMPQRWVFPGMCAYIEYQDEETDEVEAPTFLYNVDVALKRMEDGELYWQFAEPDLVMVLNENEDGETFVEWVFTDNGVAMNDVLYSGPEFRKELRRIKRIRNIEWDKTPASYKISQNEWASIWAFHQAYVNALEEALKFIDAKEETSTKNVEHYADFHLEPDSTTYNELDCQSSELIDFRDYELYEIRQSNYQIMEWKKRSEDDDTCLHLDGMLQICSSYRPHYHEFFVHFPAQYVDSVKRVIFLGSGDSMLLHEILKYPDLEKVVGLELDQDITRKSFRHFQTQPHYDDPRVEWWYGDATKTLPLLPKEYWGSFDLVLVDLSETVVSMDVTGKHDILDVLENLLKPEGVILENELYIDKFMEHFDHTIQIFYGSPKVCTQVLTLASNKVDFLHHPIKDHGIDNYLVKVPTHDQDRFMYIHDYVKRNPSKEKCAETTSEDVVQGRTAGILEVVNYEDVALKPEKNMEQTIFSIVRKHGFTPLSVPIVTVDSVAIVAMAEGYILVRSWPEKRYCAVDIHLWGKFSKRNDLREALTAAFQSRTVSDYRIVVGGMYGSTTLASDEEDIGVRFSHNRNCDDRELEEDALINQGTLEVLSEETLSMLEGDKVVAAVVCGFENKDDCVASKMLTKVDHLFTFWTCPELIHVEGDEDSVDVSSIFACERKILEELENSPPLDMILFDDGVPLSMTQIFDSILSVPSHRNQFLKKKHVLASSFDGDRLWKMVSLAQNYRLQPHTDVVSAATFTLKGVDRKIGWVVAYAGDNDYSVLKLYELEQRVKGRLPALDICVRSLLGGKKHAEKDLEFETWTFAPEKYDAGPSLEQYNKQQPLGRQTVFQLQWTDPSASFYMCLKLLEATLKKMDYKPTRFDIFKEVGDGGAAMSVYKEGSAVLVWDGRQQVVVNLFSFDQEKERADSFVKTLEQLSGNTLQVALRDDQPRGIGRVVSFSNDINIDSKKDGSYHTEEL